MSPAKFCVSMVISDQNINRGFSMSIAKKITSGLISAILLFGLVSCKAETASTFAVITETTAKQFAPVELTEEYSGPVLGVDKWHIVKEDISWGGKKLNNVWLIDAATGKKFAGYSGPVDDISAYLADLDRDGQPELVCNEAWGTAPDFTSHTAVYRLNGGVTEIAFPCYGDLKKNSSTENYPTVAKKLGIDINEENYRSYSDKYDPVTNTIRLINVDGTEHEIPFDCLEFERYLGPESDNGNGTDLLPSDDIDIRYKAAEPEVSDVSGGEKSIVFFRDGMKIEGKLYLPKGEGPFPAIVLSCGLMQPYTDYVTDAKTFADNGYAAVVFSFIGYSDPNAPEPSDNGKVFLSETADLYAVLDSLKYLPKVDSANVYLWGHSFGGLVSAFAGCDRASLIKGLILVEPTITAGEKLAVTYEDGTSKFLRIYGLLKERKLNTVIYVGTHDGYGDKPGSFDKVLSCLPSSKLVTIDGADHFFKGEYGVKMVKDACKQIASWN